MPEPITDDAAFHPMTGYFIRRIGHQPNMENPGLHVQLGVREPGHYIDPDNGRKCEATYFRLKAFGATEKDAVLMLRSFEPA